MCKGNRLFYSGILDDICESPIPSDDCKDIMIGNCFLHKVVTSKEGNIVENVDAVDDTSVHVSSEGGRKQL